MRDYYWRRDRWGWIVATVVSDDAGWGPEAVIFKSWRESTAAKVCGLCFESYLQGQDTQRERMRKAPRDALPVSSGERGSNALDQGTRGCCSHCKDPDKCVDGCLMNAQIDTTQGERQ